MSKLPHAEARAVDEAAGHVGAGLARVGDAVEPVAIVKTKKEKVRARAGAGEALGAVADVLRATAGQLEHIGIADPVKPRERDGLSPDNQAQVKRRESSPSQET